jgi:hypothetical protein
MAAHYEQAFNLITSAKCRKAFNLREEPEPLRERYGKHKLGQATLLARRLVEHGVPLVTVFWNPEAKPGVPSTWDTHDGETKGLKLLLPPTDQAVSALLEDLAARGLLEETLVVWLGEFGRTPKLDDKGGRGHWARCGSVAMAGGGIRGGQVYGKSDRQAGYPTHSAVGPADIVTTIYHCLGIDTETEITDQLGRPLKLCLGSVIQPLLA